MSPEEIIYGIRGAEKERAAVVKYLCRDGQLWSSIRQYVKGHAGSEEDARMVFDDTIVQFIKSVFSNPAFQLQGPLNAYLMGIAKHLWYAESRRNMQRMDTFPLEDADVANDDPPALTLMWHGERKAMLQRILGQIGRNCREVLMYWANGYSMEEITQRMSYQSEGMTRKKKSICLKELIALIHQNPHLKSALE
ncbi:MAG: sigma-70 family RNA polymerase sigma factor [Saprospiraceae bacterium]|nr:sigma-70 family RNA polymerase sigma factor [Saprospiraceae bacterium]